VTGSGGQEMGGKGLPTAGAYLRFRDVPEIEYQGFKSDIPKELGKAAKILKLRSRLLGSVDEYRQKVAMKARQEFGENYNERLEAFFEEDLKKKDIADIMHYGTAVMMIQFSMEGDPIVDEYLGREKKRKRQKR